MASEGLSVRIVLVVLVRRGFRYLMVRDDNRGGTWYPPMTSLREGEDLITAAQRLVQGASGSSPVLEGIVRISHMPMLPGSSTGRLRFVLDGQLSADALVEKTAVTPASYFLPAELKKLELRERGIVDLIEQHARGLPSTPLDLYRVGLA